MFFKHINNELKYNDSDIFHEIGLDKPEFDENLYDHIYVTRRITACYSRGRNCAVGCENTCLFEKYGQKIEVPAPR